MSFRERKGQIILQGEGNSYKDRVVFYDGVNLVGRNPAKTTITIKDRSISEIHGKIICKDQNIKIVDTKSKNGIYLNSLQNQIQPQIQLEINPNLDVVYFAQIKCKLILDPPRKQTEDQTKKPAIKNFKPQSKGQKTQENYKDKKTLIQNSSKLNKQIITKQKHQNNQISTVYEDQKATKKHSEQNKIKSKQIEKNKKIDRQKQLVKAINQELKNDTQENQTKQQQTRKNIKDQQIQDLNDKKGQKKKTKKQSKQKQKKSKEKQVQKEKQKPILRKNEKQLQNQQKSKISKNNSKQKNNTKNQNQKLVKDGDMSKQKIKKQTNKKQQNQNKKQRVLRNEKRAQSGETKVKGKGSKRNKSMGKPNEGTREQKRIQGRKKLPQELNQSFGNHSRRSIVQKTALISGFVMAFKPTVRITISQNWREKFDVLVMEKYIRTFKLLYAICLGAPVVTLNWIIESQYRRGVVPVERFYLPTPQKDLISNSISIVKSGAKVFGELKFHLIQSEHAFHMQIDQIEALIQAGGGTIVRKLNKKQNNPKDIIYIIRNQYGNQDIKLLKKIEGAEKVYTVQMILDSCLHQQIDWSKNKVVKA